LAARFGVGGLPVSPKLKSALAEIQKRCAENAQFARKNSFRRTITEHVQQQSEAMLREQQAMRG
jgi:hypothetical protein